MPDSNIHPEQEAQKRRSSRIVQAVPLTVTGVDALGRPFQERTSTLIINCHGARYQSKHYVLKNMWVTLEVPHNEQGQPARSVRGRVTWIQRPRTVRELFQIGVELEVGGNVWGIAFPPSDWFPFPESGAAPTMEIPAPSHHAEALHPATESHPSDSPSHEKAPEERVHVAPPQEAAKSPVVPISAPPEAAEDKVHVMPSPLSDETSQQIARHVTRLVAEAKQQIEAAARESANQAMAEQTRPLLATLQAQLKEAAEKSVTAASAAHIEKLQQETVQRVEREREAAVAAMLTQLSSELDNRLAMARQQIDAQLADVESARRQEFEQLLQNQLQAAIHKMESLSGSMGKNQDEVLAVMEHLRVSSAQAAAEEIRRWKEQMDSRTAEAQARLAEMDQSARKLGEQIAAATAVGEVGWRGLLEADLEAANARWQQRIENSIHEVAERAADQIAKNAEAAAQQAEQKLHERFETLSVAHAQVSTEAEAALMKLRSELSGEAAKSEEVVSKFHDSIAQLDARRGEFSAMLQNVSDEWARRSEAMLEGQSAEMNRRAESTVAGMSQRLQPMLEAAGHESIEKLAAEFEQRFSPQIAHASEILGQLALHSDRAEKAAAEHQQRVWQISDQGLQESAARGKEILAQIESEFTESARNASTRWLAELETRATETSHNTFETLYKSADWYEKKIQTQMQTTLEKGLEQAAARLREKAAEMSGLFASELDHYSRSYVEHAHGQIQENAREAADQATQQMAQARETAAANFTERVGQLSDQHFDGFSTKSKAIVEQNAAAMEAHVTQVRTSLEANARGFAAEFQNALTQHAQDTLALGKQQLGLQVDRARDSLLVESQALERHFQSALNTHGDSALEEHKQRLENASNTWLLTTVTKLNQQSEQLIAEMSDATEKKLKVVCGNVFTDMGEVLRQRMAGLSSAFAPVPAVESPKSPTPQDPEQTK